MRLKSFVASPAMPAMVVLQATPARAAWAQEVPLSIQVIGYFPSGASQTLGRADGVVQFNDGYQLPYGSTFIGQSHTVFTQDRIFNNPY